MQSEPDLDAGEDAGDGPQGEQEAGDGAQLARVPVTEVGDDLEYGVSIIRRDKISSIRSKSFVQNV